MQVHEYAPAAEINAIALLWHGRGVHHASAMRPLAQRIARRGVLTLTVDWDSEADDRGRADLLASLKAARDRCTAAGLDPDDLVIAGWSLGGSAALSLATHAKRLGIALGGVVLIAPGDGERLIEPITGASLPATFPPGAGRCGIDLVYGHDDPLATPDLVAGLELRLRSSGWRTSLHAVDTDHAGVVGTRYDERTERYIPSRAAHATRAADVIAELVATSALP